MRLLVLVLVAACGARTYTGSHVTAPERGTPLLASGRVFIPVTRRHIDEFHDKGGVAALFTNDAAHDDEETTKVDHVGVIVVDVRTGRCTVERSASGTPHPAWLAPVVPAPGQLTPTGAAIPRAARWLPGTDGVVANQHLIDVVTGMELAYVDGVARAGDRLFLPTHFDGVVELTAAPIARVATYAPPLDLSRRDLELYVAGFEDGVIAMFTYRRTSIFLFELATRTWRELPYDTCVSAERR